MGIRNLLIDLLYIFAPEMDPRLGVDSEINFSGERWTIIASYRPRAAVQIAAAWQEGALVSTRASRVWSSSIATQCARRIVG
jgi:hypothetical protein